MKLALEFLRRPLPPREQVGLRGAEKAEIDELALKARLAGSCFIRFRHFRNGGCHPELVGLVRKRPAETLALFLANHV
jgi:hypothetical protein